MPDTKQCPNCGTMNSSSNALCENCKTPLTAYSGQLTGEVYRGKLADQVAALDRRPPIVIVMTVFNIVFALFWPLASVLSRFAKHQAEGDGAYLGAAFGAIGTFLSAIVLIPLTLALIGLAIATFLQHTWTWTANAVALGLFALAGVIKFSSQEPHSHLMAIVYIVAAGVLAYFWYRPQTKAWFGLS